MWCLILHSREQQLIFANLCQKTTVTEAMIGPRELSAEGQEHWHAFIQFNAQRTDRWRNEFADKLNNMWIRPLQTETNESIIQARQLFTLLLQTGKTMLSKIHWRTWTSPQANITRISEWRRISHRRRCGTIRIATTGKKIKNIWNCKGQNNCRY